MPQLISTGAPPQWSGIEILDIPNPEISRGILCGKPYTKLLLPLRDLTGEDWQRIQDWLTLQRPL